MIAWGSAPLASQTVKMRDERIVISHKSATYSRGSRYFAELGAVGSSATEQTRLAIELLAELVDGVDGAICAGASYPPGFVERCEWFSERLTMPEAWQLAGVVLVGRIEGKSVRPVDTQS